MLCSLAQTETSSEAVHTVPFQYVAGTSPLVNCCTAAGQQSKSILWVSNIVGNL